MSTLFNIIVVIQVISALVIIGLVLLQHGKGADMGAAFGSGASGSLFVTYLFRASCLHGHREFFAEHWQCARQHS